MRDIFDIYDKLLKMDRKLDAILDIVAVADDPERRVVFTKNGLQPVSRSEYIRLRLEGV